ncbi:hypothetical protein [Bacillus sp. FJAT-27986]|uniref:hypothetical protein n=1 Tax=Bacillus sp. FJAT-27986 TaxID=1743146 RepID=UPI00080AF80D|nr:hypothetical protein [Bacillus sp. FJAT-27986]OCA86150.1 hypothetical protein A8L44_06965 [Bacillus sp. FJAT-27986]
MNLKQAKELIGKLNKYRENEEKHSNQYRPLYSYKELVMLYPGKYGGDDYLIKHNGCSITHIDIVKYLHGIANKEGNNPDILLDFILDVFQNGLCANDKLLLNLDGVKLNGLELTMEKLKYIIFWVPIQEEYNYPRPRNNGIKFPYKRYIEAIVAADNQDLITIDEVIERSSNKKGRGKNEYPKELEDYVQYKDELPIKYKKALDSLEIIACETVDELLAHDNLKKKFYLNSILMDRIFQTMHIFGSNWEAEVTFLKNTVSQLHVNSVDVFRRDDDGGRKGIIQAMFTARASINMNETYMSCETIKINKIISGSIFLEFDVQIRSRMANIINERTVFLKLFNVGISEVDGCCIECDRLTNFSTADGKRVCESCLIYLDKCTSYGGYFYNPLLD